MAESEISGDLSLIFLSILQFYRAVFENKNIEEKSEEEFITHSIKWIGEFITLTSNDVLVTKYPQIYQEVGKETIYYLCSIMNSYPTLIAQIANGFGKILMSNTLLFSSPLGQTYFSILGNTNITKGNREAISAALNVLKFYKIKESDGSKQKKKEKNYTPIVQFWSIFILLIINEYSIGRNIHEDNTGLKESLTSTEISIVPSNKLENYLGWVKIINNVVEFMKHILNKKQKEKEAFIFIASFIKIWSNSQGKYNFPWVLSILRFRRVFTHSQIKKMCNYIKRLADETEDSDNKNVLVALVEELNLMKDDMFGLPETNQESKEVPLSPDLSSVDDIKMEDSQNERQPTEK